MEFKFNVLLLIVLASQLPSPMHNHHMGTRLDLEVDLEVDLDVHLDLGIRV